MLRAGVGLSTLPEPGRAAEEACAEALAGAGRCDAAILVTGPGRGDALGELLGAATAALGSDAVVGTTAHGVLAPDREHVADGALVVLAVSGIEAHPFLIPDAGGREAAAAEELAARLGPGRREEDLVVLFPDPRTLDLAALLAELGGALGDARIVGAGSADPISGVPLQFEGREVVYQPERELLAVKRRYGVMFQRGALFSSLTVARTSSFLSASISRSRSSSPLS